MWREKLRSCTRSSEQFLREKVKVNGKTGNLGNVVHIERFKDKLIVISEKQFSKRYLKYLTKKYLKKNNLCDWRRVVASDKETYELRSFQISQDEGYEIFEDDVKRWSILETLMPVMHQVRRFGVSSYTGHFDHSWTWMLQVLSPTSDSRLSLLLPLSGRTLAELMKPVGPLGLPVEEFMDSLASLPRSLEMYRSRETGTSSWPDMLKEFCARRESYRDSIGVRIWRSGRSDDQAFGTEAFTEELYKNLILDSKESNQTQVCKANLALKKAEYDME
ncbi:hypothetical protein MJT46_013587 [Ovis ammon polii x Ovis aries]|nr:hypothetical protein MJT46_013587 [Ovis ammon polii x Ovis aries]